MAVAIRAVKNSICGRQQPADDEEDDEKLRERQGSVLLLDMGTYLEMFPKCKSLMLNIRSNAGGENKTPLAVLHEYATRCSLEVNQNMWFSLPLSLDGCKCLGRMRSACSVGI